jgi:hypothetical protein
MNRQILTTYTSQVRDLLNEAMSRTDSGDAHNRFRERVRNRFEGLLDRCNAILNIDLPTEDADSDIGRTLEDVDVCIRLHAPGYDSLSFDLPLTHNLL